MSTLTCNHCSVTFPDHPEGVVLLGMSDEQKKLFQYVHIEKHLEIMHSQVHMGAALLVGKLKWLTVMAHVSDEGTAAQPGELWHKRRQIAAEISHATGREVTDEDIEHVLMKFDLNLVPDGFLSCRAWYSREEVRRLLRNLRDQMAYKDVLKDAAEPATTTHDGRSLQQLSPRHG